MWQSDTAEDTHNQCHNHCCNNQDNRKYQHAHVSSDAASCISIGRIIIRSHIIGCHNRKSWCNNLIHQYNTSHYNSDSSHKISPEQLLFPCNLKSDVWAVKRYNSRPAGLSCLCIHNPWCNNCQYHNCKIDKRLKAVNHTHNNIIYAHFFFLS